MLGLLAPVAGVGLVYLLRDAAIAGSGPRVSGALPLEQLAGADAQPLLRMVVAWIPIGIAVGGLIAVFTRSAWWLALAVLVLVAGVVLVVSGGMSNALTNNLPLTSELSTPLSDAGTWLALGLLVIGAAIGERLAVAVARAPSAA